VARTLVAPFLPRLIISSTETLQYSTGSQKCLQHILTNNEFPFCKQRPQVNLHQSISVNKSVSKLLVNRLFTRLGTKNVTGRWEWSPDSPRGCLYKTHSIC